MSRLKAAILAATVLVLSLLIWDGVAQAQVTERVSVAVDGSPADGNCDYCSVSADGRYVAFHSDASNLVAGDTNGMMDVFVYDRVLGTTNRVNVNSQGEQTDGGLYPSISADGRYVAFTSYATDLVEGDTNGAGDVFVHDLADGTNSLVSVSGDDVQGNALSNAPSISADGRYVVFQSEASNLVTGDTNGMTDVFIRDRVLGTTNRVSVSSDETQANEGGVQGRISADGRRVTFWSYATNLVPSDTNGGYDIFVRDMAEGTTQRASVDNAGTEGNSHSNGPASISADGRYVVFQSEASNLVTGDTNGVADIFVRDLAGGVTSRVSVNSAGIQGNGRCYDPHAVVPASISGDGRYVAFDSTATNLAAGDTNGKTDIFVHDRQTGLTTLASQGSAGIQASAGSYNPSISAEGLCVAFESSAANLVSGDTNYKDDIFIGSELWNPTITGLAPAYGSTSGGASVTITGTFFAGATAVTFGGNDATTYNVDSPTQITATAPPHDPGTVRVVVVSAEGPSADVAADDFTYVAPPAITKLDPTAGPVTGGTVVTITGNAFVGLSGPDAVTFGGANALGYTVDSDTQVTATSPNHVAGTVQVRVTTPGGSTENTAADDYTYEAVPIPAHERVSVDSDEAQGNNRSGFPSASGDGRFVAFESDANNLVPGDTNGQIDVFVRDRATGITERVSVASDGTQAIDASGDAAISADGRFVAFVSIANNLVAGDLNSDGWEVFVHDRQTGSTELVSVSSAEVQGNGTSVWTSLSNDGRYVCFCSSSSNLVSGDTNDLPDIFVRDRTNGTTERVSVSSSEVQANDWNDFASISADGRYVVFDSMATNLVTGDTNGKWDAFVRDRIDGTTQRVSLAGASTQGNDDSGNPRISADGRYVVFDSDATNLVAGDTNGVVDVFVRDRVGGTTTRVSVSSAGAQGIGDSGYPAMSADGRYVVFESDATNLVADDTNGMADIFVRDRTSGTTRRVSRDAAGVQADYESYWPSISADGMHIAFSSVADNLVPDDTNGAEDVFAVLIGSRTPYSSLRGSDRFDTAIKVSQAMFPAALYPDGLPADSGVVLAPGWESYQEALCGAPLAAAWGGPVLLSSKTLLYTAVKDELVRLDPDQVFLIGLTGTTVADAIKAVLPAATVTSINGTADDVYHMSYLVAKKLEERVEGEGGDMAQATGIVTIGSNFPDAIGVSPLACYQKWPVLLTDYPDNRAMNAYAVQAMNELGITSYVKAGTYTPDPTGIAGLANFSGADRYQTNQKVATWASASAGLTFAHTALTTGDKFPDALAGGPYLAQDHGTLLLSPLTGPLPVPIATLLTTHAAEVQHFTFIAMIEPVVSEVKALLP